MNLAWADAAYFLPEIILLATAAIVLLLERPLRRLEADVGSWVALLGLALAGVAALRFSTTGEALGGAFVRDAFTSTFELAAIGVGVLATLLGSSFLRAVDYRRSEFFPILLLTLTGVMIAAGARDFLLLFVGLETLALGGTTLLGFFTPNEKSREALMKSFITSGIATAFLLLGFAFVFGVTGTTRYSDVAAHVALHAGNGHPFLELGFGFVVISLLVRIMAFPFNMFASDALQGAPGPAAGAVAVTSVLGGFAALFRIFEEAGAGSCNVAWSTLLAIAAGSTMVLSSLYATYQDNVKRMLSYATLAHVGFLLMGFAVAYSPRLAPEQSEAVLAAVVYYLLGFVFLQAGAFALVSAVFFGRRFGEYLAEFRGLGRRCPVAGIAYVAVFMSLAGFPPTFAFLAKVQILGAALQAEMFVLIGAAILGSLIGAFYHLRVLVVMYFRENPHAPGVIPSVPLVTAMALVTVGVLGVGLFPEKALQTAIESVRVLF